MGKGARRLEIEIEGEAGQAETQPQAAVYLAQGPEDLGILELERPSRFYRPPPCSPHHFICLFVS